MLKNPLACLLLTTLFAANCGNEPVTESAATTASSAPAAASSPVEASAYPAVYRDLGLPVLPGGVVTSSGRQTTSLRDGLSIHVASDRPVSEVRTFLDEALRGAGWTSTATGPGARVLPNLPAAGLAFERDDLRFTATITAADGGSVVSISVLER